MRTSQVPEGSDEIRALYVWLDERLVQMSDSQKESHTRLRNDMQNGFLGVNARLDPLNGKTSRHDVEIGILKDRSERAERQGGIIGAITGGLTAGIVLIAKSLFR